MERRRASPGVDDVLLPGLISVGVEQQVTVATEELAVGGWVHGDLVAIFHTPDLDLKKNKNTHKHEPNHNKRHDKSETHWRKLGGRRGRHLELAGAVIHHAVLSRHDLVLMERGGIEGHLRHLGNLSDDEGVGGSGGLVLVQPVEEELLEEAGLAARRHDHHLVAGEQRSHTVVGRQKRGSSISLCLASANSRWCFGCNFYLR